MHRSTGICAAIAFFVLSGHIHGSANRTVEVPMGRGGEVQVAEIISRLARASDTSLERPAADLTLSTQGLARADQDLAFRNARP